MAFPTDFRWGLTSSSVQAEGVAPTADWSAWERAARVPQSNEGGGLAVDFLDDFRLFAQLGITDVRLTCEWARIEPAPGKLNTDAIDFYTDVLRSARHAGLAPWVTIQSTTLPGWFNEDDDGFRDATACRKHWMPQVDRCADAFGDLAEGFTPIDDPVGWAVRGYLLGSRPPGKRDSRIFRDALLAALEADHAAAQLLKSAGMKTMAVRGVPTIFGAEAGAEPWVQFWTAIFLDSWADAMRSGHLAVPDLPVRIREEWTDDFDYVGLSFDHPIGVTSTGALTSYPRTARRADTGFAPIPNELGVMLERIHDRLPGRSFMIASNGVATRDDEWREQLLRETVGIVESFVKDGMDLTGYFHDTGIDGYEWHAGFDTQRGLVGRDRQVKESGVYLSSVMLAGRDTSV